MIPALLQGTFQHLRHLLSSLFPHRQRSKKPSARASKRVSPLATLRHGFQIHVLLFSKKCLPRIKPVVTSPQIHLNRVPEQESKRFRYRLELYFQNVLGVQRILRNGGEPQRAFSQYRQSNDDKFGGCLRSTKRRRTSLFHVV